MSEQFGLTLNDALMDELVAQYCPVMPTLEVFIRRSTFRGKDVVGNHA